MNSARLTIEREGIIVYEEDTTMDRFEELRQGAGPTAQVGMNVGSSQDFGKLKIGAHVTLTCDQNEVAIEAAGYRALMKCLELTTKGMQLLTQEEGT